MNFIKVYLPNNERKLLEEKSQYKYYCKCSHYTHIYPFEKVNKKICTWCGNYIYANKKEEFKDKLRKAGIK